MGIKDFAKAVPKDFSCEELLLKAPTAENPQKSSQMCRSMCWILVWVSVFVWARMCGFVCA